MNTKLRVLLVLGPILGLVAGVVIERQILNGTALNPQSSETAMEHAEKHLDPTYVCPMHAEITSKDEGSSCPICGMDLVAVKQSTPTEDEDDGHPVVEVSPSIMNSLGVRTVKLIRKDISRRVETPGFVQQVKKGKMSTYRAPFDGVVTELLYEPRQWYEDSGIPLVSLSSETLLNAQEQHIAIFANADIDTDSKQTVEKTDEEDSTDENQKTVPTDNFLDADGKLTEEYRDKLIAMGHNAESIAQLEKEMLATMGTPSSDEKITPEKQKKKVTQKTTTTDTKSIDDNEVMTLDESRKHLRSLGMRNQEITKLERTGNASDKLTLYTNGEGRVINMSFKKGYSIRKGETIFRYGGQVRAVVVANAFQRDAAWITTGQRVEIRMPHERGIVWPGIVNQGAISINPDSQNIGIKLTFTAPLDKVRSNMYVLGTIFGDTRKDVIAVPTQSIIRTEGEDRVVKALGNGRFKPVTVKLGAEAGDLTEIIEGLEEGDEVVVMAHFLIDSESSLQASLQRLNSL